MYARHQRQRDGGKHMRLKFSFIRMGWVIVLCENSSMLGGENVAEGKIIVAVVNWAIKPGFLGGSFVFERRGVGTWVLEGIELGFTLVTSADSNPV